MIARRRELRVWSGVRPSVETPSPSAVVRGERGAMGQSHGGRPPSVRRDEIVNPGTEVPVRHRNTALAQRVEPAQPVPSDEGTRDARALRPSAGGRIFTSVTGGITPAETRIGTPRGGAGTTVCEVQMAVSPVLRRADRARGVPVTMGDVAVGADRDVVGTSSGPPGAASGA